MSTRPRPGLVVAVVVLLAAWRASAQDVPAGPPLQLVRPEGPSAPPVVVTLRDALERAKENDAQFRSTAADAEIAREDRSQTKSSALPALSHTTQYLGTQSNDVLPSGRFVTNDGVHVFRSWAVLRAGDFREDLVESALPAGRGRRGAGKRTGRRSRSAGSR